MNKEKICFKSDGTKETGAKIIKALEELGSINKSIYHGDLRNYYYFIAEDADNVITYEDRIPKDYILKDIHTWKKEDNKPTKDKPFYVVVTEENKEVLSKWKGSGSVSVGNIVGFCLWIHSNSLKRAFNNAEKIKGSDYDFGNKITFEQFLELYPECKEDVKPKFEVGQWYRCSCNKNYYRFVRIKDNKYFVNDAQINPTGEQSSDVLPGYIERLKEKSLLDYFTDYTPVSLSEIQQYLPDSHEDKILKQELTELPEKWYVKATIENRDVLRKWRGGDYTNWDNNLVMLDAKIWVDIIKYPLQGYTEITFDQFKKWVLKEDVIPEYVIYIDTKYKGQVVKVIDWTASSYCKVEFPDGKTEQPFKHLVKSYVFPKYEEPFKEISKEELLAYAQEHYPIGTKFKSFEDDGCIRVVTLWNKETECTWYIDEKKGVRSYNGIGDKGGCSNPAIYQNGKWAEIIEEKVDVLVQTTMDQLAACDSCKYSINCNSAPDKNKDKNGCCIAADGQHYPKDEVKEVKPQVEEWSVGTWVVVTDKYQFIKRGDVYQIEESGTSYILISKQVGKSCLPYKKCLKWFATKGEAENFSRLITGKIQSVDDFKPIQVYKNGEYTLLMNPRENLINKKLNLLPTLKIKKKKLLLSSVEEIVSVKSKLITNNKKQQL